MSRLFLTRRCEECPPDMLVAAVADWLMSQERMRFLHETPRDKLAPGTCMLCGGRTSEAFVLRREAEPTRNVEAGTPAAAAILRHWQAGDTYADKTGATWGIVPLFFCERAMQGPTRSQATGALIARHDPFSRAEAEVRRRNREAARADRDNEGPQRASRI